MLKQILMVSCAVFGLVIILMYVFQRHLIYFPNRHVPQREAFDAMDLAQVSLTTSDNKILNGWYKPAAKNHPTVLYLHGNAGHIGYRMPIARQLINAKMGVFLLDYRGYGGNKGSPSESGFYEDAYTALRFLDQKGVKEKSLVLYGESLGTGVATKLASSHPACALILQTPFTSLTNVAHFHYPWLSWMEPWDKYDSLSRIKSIHTPLLILHGTDDPVVPYAEGLALFKAAKEPKKMMTFDHLNHHNLWNDRRFYKELIQFIQVHC